MKHLVSLCFALLSISAGAADDPDGQVHIPLDLYNQLVEASHNPVERPADAPAAYALGTASVEASVDTTDPKASARVAVTLNIEVFEDGWVGVPVLAAGTPVEKVTVNNHAVQLIAASDGLLWGTQKKGSYAMRLDYRVDATRFDSGYVLALPVPPAAAINLGVELPGSELDVAVIPAAAVRTATTNGTTRVTATLPTTRGVQISWRTPVARSHSVSRASYLGRLDGDAVNWQATFQVEIFADEAVTLELMPRTAVMRELGVDGKESPILLENGAFATVVRGRGRHQVVAGFQVPVRAGSGPPHVQLTIPEVPVSRFDLSLPGKKEVTVSPAANVTHRESDGRTVATFFVPLGHQLSFSWSEAVPEAVKTELRANAAIYHAVTAQEGVLDLRALVDYEITRGETSLVKLLVPSGVQVNRVTSPSGAVADWRITESKDGATRELSVFLDRKMSGKLLLEISFDRALAREEVAPLPLIRAADAQRQRGMVALLASKELTLKPVADGGAARVGENQLPAFVRETIELTIAHTFKYVDLPEGLTVQAAPPERRDGRFDAQVDTLISLGEVSLRGNAGVEINLKSGGIMDLELELPTDVNLLSLAGPSLRNHELVSEAGRQRILVHFTQEMEGQLRLELSFERLMSDADAAVEVPRVGVPGAEVEQGRLAIEALSAVEVQPVVVEQLSVLDIAELPRQLLLRTTNPILHAFKYVHSDNPIRLALELTRHKVVEVQEAAIDTAHYSTLFTADGLAVTTAELTLRNSRKQFLRVELPEGSTVWSASVNGKPEKPALGEGEHEGSVLVKIVTSTEGFPVRLIYATEAPKVRGLGIVRGLLPRPDILVTDTTWDVYLPDGMSYATPRTNMKCTVGGVHERLDPSDTRVGATDEDGVNVQAVGPLQIHVPATGIHFAFAKLYANQREETAWFAVSYASAGGARAGSAANLVAVLVMWSGVLSLVGLWPRLSRRRAVAVTGLGALAVVLVTAVYRASLAPAIAASVLILAALAARHGWHWRLSRMVPPPAEAEG